MAPLTEGSRSHGVSSRYGGIAPRWRLVDSEHRPVQAPRTVDKPRGTQGQREGAACQTRRRLTFAGAAEAPPALATCTPGVHATFLHEVAVRASPRYGTRGRPRQGAQAAPIVSTSAGALASSLAAPSPRVDPQSCCILATPERAETRWSPTALFASDKGQRQAERGCRFLQAPAFLASALSRQKPERLMALLMIMTVCLLG
jgi:hypothetical protein